MLQYLKSQIAKVFSFCQVMKGYLDNPDATSATICPDGWLHTGDIASYNENHQFFIVDRLKELIKVKGYQVRFR